MRFHPIRIVDPLCDASAQCSDDPNRVRRTTVDGMSDQPVRRRIATNGIELSVLEAGPADGPVVVLAHGFPELAFSWRHQIGPLAAAGYHVLAPDQRGYGASSRPQRIDDYDVIALTGDLLGLLDSAGAEQAVFIGHDWGSALVWQQALINPQRVRAVVGLSTPLLPRSKREPVATMKYLFRDRFYYVLHFQEPGPADAELDADVRKSFLRMFGGMRSGASGFSGLSGPSGALPDDGRGFLDRLDPVTEPPGWITAEDFAVFVDTFTETGFTGGLNWYRTFDRNWHLTAPIADRRVAAPALFVHGSQDPVVDGMDIDRSIPWFDDYRGTRVIEGAGHWLQQERPEEVTATLLDFLADLPDPTS